MSEVKIQDIKDYLKDKGEPLNYKNVKAAAEELAEVIPIRENKKIYYPQKCNILIAPDRKERVSICYDGMIIEAPTFQDAVALYIDTVTEVSK